MMHYNQLNSCPRILREFLSYYGNIKGASSLSLEEYYFDLQTYFRFILCSRGMVPSGTEFDEIDISDFDWELLKDQTLEDLYAFLSFCKEERHNSAVTRARKTSSLRIFYKYLCEQRRLLENNPTALLEAPGIRKSLPHYLTLEESIALLNSVDGPNAQRDYCILTFFLNCGMRLSELCNINLSDIRADGSLRLLGKGNKERIVYLNDACLTALQQYLKVRPQKDILPKDSNALFISRNHRRISNKTVQHLVDVYLKKAGLDGRGYSTHKLRHTAATLMYQKGGVDIRVLKEILGHANLGTTQIYTHVANQQVVEAIRANPLAHQKQTLPALEKKSISDENHSEDDTD